MTETRVARVMGIGALVCVALSWLQFPLWVIGGPPSVYDGAGYARHLFDIRTTALLRVLMDQGLGPAIIANFPPLIWFLVVGVVLIRPARADANAPIVAQQRRSV